MKTKKTKRNSRAFLLESNKPEMIETIETAFGLGDRTWDADLNFSPNNIHLISMFDIINKYIFENKLDRSEKKIVANENEKPEYKHILAAFDCGVTKGEPHKIIVVRHPPRCNFFNVFCAMIHEMIHLYDFCFGPLGKMINESLLVGQLNWGRGYSDSPEKALKDTKFPREKPESGYVFKGDFLELKKSQLPDEMPNFNCAKQYQFPWFKNPKYADFYMRTGRYHPSMTPEKYNLSDAQLYDVHGSFFKNLAYRANYLGFDVTETFNPFVPHRLRKTWESETEKTPANPAEAIAFSLKTNSKIGFEYRDERNWGVEIF